MTVNLKRCPLRFARMRRPALWLGFLLQAVLLGHWPAQAQENRPPDYRVKAAFMYNFGKFVDWPDAAFAGPNAPLVIGVLGGDAFHGDCERFVANKSINGHPVIRRPVFLRLCQPAAQHRRQQETEPQGGPVHRRKL
jgi:hypothetical protein